MHFKSRLVNFGFYFIGRVCIPYIVFVVIVTTIKIKSMLVDNVYLSSSDKTRKRRPR